MVRLPRTLPHYDALRLIEELPKRGLRPHGVIVVRAGEVIGEAFWKPYAADLPHELWSLTKSFAATGIGFLVAEGRVRLDDRLVDLFPSHAPYDGGGVLPEMRLRHLLTMSAGHSFDPLDDMWADPEGDWVSAFFRAPVEHAPGTHFVYSTGASFMLSAIVQRFSGENLTDYLRPRLFEPLGFGPVTMDKNPAGIDLGGFGMSLVLEDVAKFGELYRLGGRWDGAQVLPEGWAEEATAYAIENGPNGNSDWNQGYGFQFWRCRYGAFRGDGAFGQFCVVIPENETTVAIFSDSTDLQATLDCVWEFLAPKSVPYPVVLPNALYGYEDRWNLEENDLGLEAIGLCEDGDGWALEILSQGGRFESIRIGRDDWRESVVGAFFHGPRRTLGRGGWVSDDVFEARLVSVHTAQQPLLRIQLTGLETMQFSLEGALGFHFMQGIGPIRGRQS